MISEKDHKYKLLTNSNICKSDRFEVVLDKLLFNTDFTEKEAEPSLSTTEELLVQLYTLQKKLDEIIQRCSLDLTEKITLMIRLLELNQTLDMPAIIPNTTECKKIAEDISSLKIDHKKNDIKDIIKIEKLIKEIMFCFPVVP